MGCNVRHVTSPVLRCAFRGSTGCAGTSHPAKQIGWKLSKKCWCSANQLEGPRMETGTAYNQVARWAGGSPLGVLLRLILLSILVGVILSALGLDPFDIMKSIERLIRSIWNMGFDALRWLWRYFLLGAVIVIPI